MPKGFPKRGDELMPLEGGVSGSGGGMSTFKSAVAPLAGIGAYAGLAKMTMDAKKEQAEKAYQQRKIDSKEQYEHEKEAGDPNAVKLSFEEWKKL